MKYIVSSLFSIGFICIVLGIVLETTTNSHNKNCSNSKEPDIPGPELTTQYHAYPETITPETITPEVDHSLGRVTPKSLKGLTAPPPSKVYATVAFPTEKEQ